MAVQQRTLAVAALDGLFAGLLQLVPEDAAYAAMGRAYGYINGADQATIDGIVDRDTAAGYVATLDWWAGSNVDAINALGIPQDAKNVLLYFHKALVQMHDMQAIVYQGFIKTL